MSDINTVSQEKNDLSLHVDLCAQRYMLLEKRLEIVEVKVDKIMETIEQGRKSMNITIITTGGSIIAGILGLALTIFLK